MEDSLRRVVDVDIDVEDVEESGSYDGRYICLRFALRVDEVVEEVVSTNYKVDDVEDICSFSDLAKFIPICSYTSDSEMDGQSRFVPLLQLHLWRSVGLVKTLFF